MSIRPNPRASRALTRGLQSRSMPAMRARGEALRLRLARRGPARAGVRWTAPAGVSAIERVMRRSAVHLSRHYTAHLSVQALLAAGTSRQTQRIEWQPPRRLAVSAPVTHHLERVLATQQVLRERVLQRLTRTVAPAVTPRLTQLTRVELRQAAPRIQLTLLRTQVVAAAAGRAGNEPAVAMSPPTRAAPAQPRGIASTAPLELPPQELSRLTDHVIRQLDHRVLSWQERTGRI